jgi:hypothetical protein
MAETADAVVVELEARLGNYQRDVQKGANAFDQSMKKIASSASDAEKSTGEAFGGIAKHSGNARVAQQMLMHVSRSTADQFAAGAPVAMILTGHIAQLAEAATFAGGSMGKFGQFLSGPWGIATTIAATVMANLISKIIESGDETGKALKKLQDHAKETEAADRAQKIFSGTLDGVTDALRTNRKALDELDAGQKTAARQALENAIASKLRLEGIRNETQALIDQARVQLEVKRVQASGPGQRGELAALGVDDRTKTLDALETRLGKITGAIAEADRQIQVALSHRVVELSGRDKIQEIKDRYDRLISQVRERAVAEHTVSTELARQTKHFNDQRDAEIKRAQEASRKPRSGNNSMTGREVTPSRGRVDRARRRAPGQQFEPHLSPSRRRSMTPGSPPACRRTIRWRGLAPAPTKARAAGGLWISSSATA